MAGSTPSPCSIAGGVPCRRARRSRRVEQVDVAGPPGARQDEDLVARSRSGGARPSTRATMSTRACRRCRCGRRGKPSAPSSSTTSTSTWRPSPAVVDMWMSSGRTPMVTFLPAAPERVSRCTGTVAVPNLTPPSTVSARNRFIAGRADEAGDEDVLRVVVQVARGADLLQDAILEHRDAVAHGQGLGLVVGDVDGGDAEAALQRGDLGAGLDAELGVEVRQRLVHEEDLRLAHDGAAHGDALALATGERLRLAVEVRLEVEELGGLETRLARSSLADAGDLQREAHVVGDGHVRVERVVLEDHRDVAVLRRHVGDVAVADEDVAVVDLFEAGEHAQGGGLATAGGADEDEEFAVFDVEVELRRQRGGWNPGRCGLPCQT